MPGGFFLPPDGIDSLLESGPAKEGSGMVIGGEPGFSIADQYGKAHAVPGALGLVALIAVVVAVILGRRGK